MKRRAHCKDLPAAASSPLKMEDSPSRSKRARMENSPVKGSWSAGEQFASPNFPQCKGKKDYLKRVSNLVAARKNETIQLVHPAGATWKIGDLDDTIYRGKQDELNGWGKFYLPEIVSMQVVGVVKEILCAPDQLVLMTCENRKLYAFDGEKLHLVASSLEQLRYEGIQYPASERYYVGEAFKDMTETAWANVRKRLDQEHHELVMSKKSEFLKNLKIIKQNMKSGRICVSSDCGGKPEYHNTGRTNSTKKNPKLCATHRTTKPLLIQD